jgi:nucleoside-diphosphate kinase
VASALVIFKPDAAHRLAVRDALVTWLQEERGWKLSGLTWYKPPAELIQGHYDFLQGRPFFPWLVDFMTALPVLVGRLEAAPADLDNMRYALGETRIAESRPGSLRERFGIWGGINCLHLSDSPESGDKETQLWGKYLDLSHGSATLEPAGDRPDHTFHLRSLFNQVAAKTHAELAIQESTKLLNEETDLTGNGFGALCRILLGAIG